MEILTNHFNEVQNITDLEMLTQMKLHILIQS